MARPKVPDAIPLPPLPVEIVPHPKAPLFNDKTAPLLFKQLALEAKSPSFRLTPEIMDLLRQAGLVSLWFFGKYIAGYSGPFDLLNENLHVEMCNFRQSLLQPGCRGAMFLPRGAYKSTIVTELGSAWEALRWPAIRIRISNAIADKAQDFLKSIKAIFDSNDLVAALYPEFVPAHNQEAWNDTVLTLAQHVRGKKYREGTVEYGGCGGASEGHHYDLHVVDDMIGLAALNSTRGSNAVMMSTENWFWASEKPLLVSMRNSRVIVVGTRYAVDDVYDSIIKKAYVQTGYPMRNFTPSNGSWQIYYRKGIEDGQIIFPEEFTKEAYDELAKDDYWAFVTQYLNDPQEAGLAELVNYECGKAFMDVEHSEGSRPEWSLEVGMDTYKLSDCDVIMAVDPAGTEKFVSAKTSRSAVIVLATTPRDQKVVISLQVGYVPSTTMFDWIFAAAGKFRDYLRTTYLESNAGFKTLSPLLFEEERRRGIALHLRPFAASGDKDVRIRNVLQPELDAKRIYALEAYKPAIDEEIVAFPQSRRKDIVDCLATAVANRILPPTVEERERREKSKRKFAHRTTNITGY